MSAYVGLAALKEAVGLKGESDDTVDDGVLQSVIYRASALVDNKLAEIRPGWVGIAAGSNSRGAVGSNTRSYDGSGDDWLWIDDASSVASVVVDDDTVTATSWTAWPYNDVPKRALVYIAPTTSAYGLRPSSWTRGTANVDVTAYFGLPTVPDDIAQVTLALCVLFWRRYQQGDPIPGPEVAMGGRIVTSDPEVHGILDSLWPRWGVPSIGGA